MSGWLRKSMSEVPSAALSLGLWGAVPFLVLSVLSIFVDDLWGVNVESALIAYGAVILSFLGGVHWGMAISWFGTEAPQIFDRRLMISVVPSLLGWLALLLPASVALLVLAISFAAMLYIDLVAAGQGQAPSWYPALRWLLTAIVIGSLIMCIVF